MHHKLVKLRLQLLLSVNVVLTAKQKLLICTQYRHSFVLLFLYFSCVKLQHTLQQKNMFELYSPLAYIDSTPYGVYCQ